MRYIDRWEELVESIKHDLDSSDEVSLSEIREYNQIIEDVMCGDKSWEDEYN